MKILVVEDNPKIRENILTYLKYHTYIWEWAKNGEEALLKVAKYDYDIIVLDINMPIMNGREFLKALRKKWKNIPVIALTSNSTLDDKVEIFELGVDDYITKPFALKELEIRIQSLAKRKTQYIEEKISFKNIEILLWKRSVLQNKKKIELWNKEYLILEYLSKHKWYIKSKVQILEHVWWEAEERLELSSTTLEAHISTVRKKLGKDIIKTIKGVGYIIE